jgi:hypothetical protein
MTVTDSERLLMMRADHVGLAVRQRVENEQLRDLLNEIVVGGQEDAPEWWRALADRFDEIDGAAADRLRGIAALIEEAQL